MLAWSLLRRTRDPHRDPRGRRGRDDRPAAAARARGATCAAATIAEVAAAIKDMVIRGAPAIGVAAAMGLALGVRRSASGRGGPAGRVRRRCAAELAATPPDRGQPVLGHRAHARALRAETAGRGGGRPARGPRGGGPRHREARTSRPASAWATTAPSFCPAGRALLTHCNAGALATAGYGTALGVIRSAAQGRQGRGPSSRTRRGPTCRAPA